MTQGKYIEDFANGTIWFDDKGNKISFAEKMRQRAAKKAAAQRQENPDFFVPATDQRGEPQAKHNFPWRQR